MDASISGDVPEMERAVSALFFHRYDLGEQTIHVAHASAIVSPRWLGAGLLRMALPTSSVLLFSAAIIPAEEVDKQV